MCGTVTFRKIAEFLTSMICKSFILKLCYWHCTVIVTIKNKIQTSFKTLVSKKQRHGS